MYAVNLQRAQFLQTFRQTIASRAEATCPSRYLGNCAGAIFRLFALLVNCAALLGDIFILPDIDEWIFRLSYRFLESLGHKSLKGAN